MSPFTQRSAPRGFGTLLLTSVVSIVVAGAARRIPLPRVTASLAQRAFMVAMPVPLGSLPPVPAPVTVRAPLPGVLVLSAVLVRGPGPRVTRYPCGPGPRYAREGNQTRRHEAFHEQSSCPHLSPPSCGSHSLRRPGRKKVYPSETGRSAVPGKKRAPLGRPSPFQRFSEDRGLSPPCSPRRASWRRRCRRPWPCRLRPWCPPGAGAAS
jgi:hypothetical protein